MDNGTGKKHFPSFPLPAEGETIFSLFTRCKATTGFLDEVILQELTGQRLKSRLLSPLPAYLPTIASNLHNNHPCSDPLYVVRNYSIFPYLSYFMPAAMRSAFETKVRSTDLTQPIALSMGLMKYPLQIVAPPRYCHTCLQEGIQESGFPYFRREHQLPGVYFCWKHRDALFHGCKLCGEYPIRGNALALAGECKCETGIQPLRATSINSSHALPLQWLAEQSALLLTSFGSGVRDPSASLHKMAIAEGGIRPGVIDYSRIALKVVAFWGEDVLGLLNVNVFSDGKPAPWIRRFFYGDRGNRPTLLYLLLIGAYFGSVNEYELYSTNATDGKQKSSRRVVDVNGLLQKHRGILQKLIAERGGLSRSDFQQTAPGSYDFLIRNDKEFFQSKIPRAKATYSSRQERVDWSALDMIKASELKIFFEHEYGKDEKPSFITTTLALQYCKIFAKYRADSSHFPLVSEILSINLEDRDSYHKRRLRWAIIKMIRTRTPISANRLRRVACLELKVLQRNREFILSTVFEIGGDIDDRSFLA